MNRPNSILYNYKALVIRVPSPDSLTVLVDLGFRSWSMRQFRLAGVNSPDPRSTPRGPLRDQVKSDLAQQQKLLEMIALPDGRQGVNILLASEKPSYSGNFAANAFLLVGKKFVPEYCLKYEGKELFDVTSLMRDVCSGALAIQLALAFIQDIGPISFSR